MFEEMKKAIAEESGEIYDYQFAYDGPYADYVCGVYGEALEKVSKEVGDDLYVEPSIQCGVGRNDMYSAKGTTYWDFEAECDTLLEFAEEAETEEEFRDMIASYLMGKYEECEPEDDDDYDEEDDEYDDAEDEE